MKNCVYRIVNKVNNKVYIGSTIDSERRKLEHFNQLERGVHINTHLQNAYNKYGRKTFMFDIIEDNLDDGELMKREQHYIDLFNSSNRNFGYNISQYANQPDGRKYTKIYTVMIRDKLKENPISSSALALFVYMQFYLEKYSNRVALSNGNNISDKDMTEFMKCTRQCVSKLLNELETNNFIKRIGKSKKRRIYLNPYIVDAGCEIQEEVYNLFK